MRYQFIDEYHGSHNVEKMAEMLSVSRIAYYAWQKRERSERERANEELVEKIREMQEDVRYRYGSLRVKEEFTRALALT